MAASYNLLALDSVAASFALQSQSSSKPSEEDGWSANSTVHSCSASSERKKRERETCVKEHLRVVLCVEVDQSSKAMGNCLVLT
jgi:hypothetical protein